MRLPLSSGVTRLLRLERTTTSRRRLVLLFEILRLRAALVQAQVELADLRCGEQRANQLALFDELTTLPNRRHLFNCLEKALCEMRPSSPPLAVLFLDLDGFKVINDTHGHATGDATLRIVAARLRGAVRSQDVLARFGGDEFVCLVRQPLSDGQLRQLVMALIDTVERPMCVEPLVQPLSIRLSIGIALAPRDGDTADELIVNADRAMYQAKREHTGCAFFCHADAAIGTTDSDGQAPHMSGCARNDPRNCTVGRSAESLLQPVDPGSGKQFL